MAQPLQRINLSLLSLPKTSLLIVFVAANKIFCVRECGARYIRVRSCPPPAAFASWDSRKRSARSAPFRNYIRASTTEGQILRVNGGREMRSNLVSIRIVRSGFGVLTPEPIKINKIKKKLRKSKAEEGKWKIEGLNFQLRSKKSWAVADLRGEPETVPHPSPLHTHKNKIQRSAWEMIKI